MLNNFQLVAMVIKSKQVELYRIPLIQSLQQTLAEQWHQQLTDFTEGVELVAFDAAYKPDPGERFYINDFVLPEPLVEHSVETVAELPAVGSSEERLSAIRAFFGFCAA